MNKTIESFLFILIMLVSSNLFAQINSGAVERFLENQTYRIYYWKTTTNLIYPERDSVEIFMPVIISTNQNDSSRSNYAILNTRIRLNSFETKYPRYDTTFFYFIPTDGYINDIQFLTSNGALIDYKTNNSHIFLSTEFYSEVKNNIRKFESDILLYSKLQKENQKYLDIVPYSLVFSAVFGYLGYAGYRDRNKEGFSGASSLAGGIISAGVSLSVIIHSAVGFYQYFVNKSTINKISLRVENMAY